MTSNSCDLIPVYCNVYDMTDHNKYTYNLGFGIFHSAIEVYGQEYSFGGHDFHSSGIFNVPPKTELPGTKLRTSIKIGTTKLTRRQVEMLIIELGTHYSGKTYNIVSKNCNHFGNEFAKKLCGKGIPNWINRLAYFGSFFSCIIPAEDFGPGPIQPNSPPSRTTKNTNNATTSTAAVFTKKGRKLTE